MLSAGGWATVGLTATAIYHYFDSKDELVTRVVQSGYHRFGEYLSQAADHHPVGSLERLLALGDAYVRFALENQEYFRVLYNIQTRPRELKELPGGGGYDLLRGCVAEEKRAEPWEVVFTYRRATYPNDELREFACAEGLRDSPH